MGRRLLPSQAVFRRPGPGAHRACLRQNRPRGLVDKRGQTTGTGRWIEL